MLDTTSKYRDAVVSEEIDGITYTSSKLPATYGLDIMARVVKVVGQRGLAAMAGTLDVAIVDVFMALGVQIAEGLAADPGLPKALLRNVKCGALRPTGQGDLAPAFDTHFAGEYLHLAKVLGFVLGHNFAGFTLGSR